MLESASRLQGAWEEAHVPLAAWTVRLERGVGCSPGRSGQWRRAAVFAVFRKRNHDKHQRPPCPLSMIQTLKMLLLQTVGETPCSRRSHGDGCGRSPDWPAEGRRLRPVHREVTARALGTLLGPS